METVFVVTHLHELPNGEEDVKMIGVYATQRDAEDAVTRTKQLPGFCDALDGFTIDAYSIGKDHWTEGYVTI